MTTDDVEVFRTVRSQMSDLTRLRTGRLFTGDGFDPILPESARAGYRRWALADRAETAASLAEDLVGLAEAGLHPHADLVWERLAVTICGAEAAACAAPSLGEKWLPSLPPLLSPSGPRPVPKLPTPNWHAATGPTPWFAAVQRRLADALLTVWPVDQPRESIDTELSAVGWLPQRYSDTWFVRCGDVRVPLTGGQLLTWRDLAAGAAHT